MSAADKAKLDAATAAATVSTLAQRDAAGRMATVDPVAASDVATKGYVDALAMGLDWKASVRASSVSSFGRTGTLTHDGVALIAGDRFLYTHGSPEVGWEQNGIYVVAAGAWARAADADTSAEVTAGMACFVSEGTTYGNTTWVLTTDDPIVLGTTGLTFAQIGGSGGTPAIVDGAGEVSIGKTTATSTVVGRTASPTTVFGSSVKIDDIRADYEAVNKAASSTLEAGKTNYLTGADASTYTLPALSGVVDGEAVVVHHANASGTINRAGADTINGGNGSTAATSKTLAAGNSTIVFMRQSSTVWRVTPGGA